MDIGAHVSISGGMDLAISRGAEIGATAIQTFASSPRTLKFVPINDEIVKRYLAAKKNSIIHTHVFHAVYLVNLASEKPDYVQASIDSLIAYQQLAGQIGAIGTIVHVGSHKGNGFESVKKKVAKAIDEVLVASPKNTILMLENAAGHKGTIGQTIEELAELFESVSETKNLGLCLDTQHAFASGVDARETEALDSYLTQIETRVGLDKVKVIHVNDSKFECNSHRDRHENVGSGFLGDTGLSNWINNPKLKGKSFILEVPGRDGKGPGKKDVDELRALVQ